MSDRSVFVGEDHTVLVGRAAEEALKRESDSRFIQDDRGIAKVPLSRWHAAQAYERMTWMELGLSATDDRNLDYLRAFNRYRPLNGLTFDHAIELGCGPFTNLRLIAWACAIRACTLVDPLADEYLSHPHCAYTRRFLYRDPRFWLVRLARTRIGRVAYRWLAPKHLYGRIPVHRIVSEPMEQIEVQARHDLIVMINVLEHCYDADLVFERIASLATPGAYLIFRDKYYEQSKILEDVKRIRDAGHPLRVDRRVIDGFLETRCEPVLRKIQPVRFSVGGVDRSYQALSFIGRLRQ